MAEIERILVVDDEEPIRKLLARLLGAQGYECVTAESAAEARRQLSTKAFALLLSDVNMPGESGFDFAHEVHLDYPDTASSWSPASTTIASPRPRSHRARTATC